MSARIAGLFGLLLLLSGCMSSSRQVPANWQLTLNSDASANAGAPLKVRVFVLRSDANFQSADFYSLEAHYLGVMAEYANINGKAWRVVVPLPAPTETNFYKFWQFSPDALHGRINATAAGLHLTANDE